MSCSGLHCAGCGAGASVPVIPLAAFCGAVWVAGHIIEVAVICGVSGVLALAAVVALLRLADRRDARQAAAWAARRVPPAIPVAAPPALGFRDLHIHLDGVPASEQAQVIRQALSRD